jgi:hypothetical protein
MLTRNQFTPASGTVTLLDAMAKPAAALASIDLRTRVFDIATGEHLVPDRLAPAVLGGNSVGPGQVTPSYSNKVAEPVWLVLCGGRLALLLARNAGPLVPAIAGDAKPIAFTTTIPVSGVVSPDGTVTLNK